MMTKHNIEVTYDRRGEPFLHAGHLITALRSAAQTAEAEPDGQLSEMAVAWRVLADRVQAMLYEKAAKS